MTAATDKWILPEELSESQKLLPVISAWKYVDTLSDGGMEAVNLLNGTKGTITKFQVELQGLKLGFVSEVREGLERGDDVVVLYQAGYEVK